MNRTSSIFVRVEPNIKNQAEKILNNLGIPMSTAIDIFLRQVTIQQGIPFEIKLSPNKPLVFNSLTKEQFDAEISKGIEDIKTGKTYSQEEVADEIKRKQCL